MRLLQLMTVIFVLLVAGTAAATAADISVGDITITAPWSRATPQPANVAVGYLTITNHGSTADRLLSIQSDIASTATIHKMTTENGVAKMEMLDGGLPIPAGGTVELKPSSFHIMFTGLKNPLKKGDRFKADLRFEKAGQATVEFVVGGPGAQAAPGP